MREILFLLLKIAVTILFEWFGATSIESAIDYFRRGKLRAFGMQIMTVVVLSAYIFSLWI